jgi:formylglycine-generating enzyme required for sulfatase activity
MRRALLFCGALACTTSLPAAPSAVVVVDTDLQVPLAVTRLRVDVFDGAGAWIETSDVVRPDARDWPVSFGLVTDDDGRAHVATVRLRAYADGRVRDYRGARRLLRDGVDVTPLTEPDPRDAVDRIVKVALGPGSTGKVLVTLDGTCLGQGADLDADRTCVAGTMGDVSPSAPADVTPPRSVVGTFLADPPCPPSDDGAERVCVPGGATVLGSAEDRVSAIAAVPSHVWGVTRFFMDRREVTVGRFRAALAAGFQPIDLPTANDGNLGAGGVSTCTYTSKPGAREEYSLSCVSAETGRAFCRFLGGDLPTEAQWEHAATTAGKQRKSLYPWGDRPPTCADAAYARNVTGGIELECANLGIKPPPPEASDGDRTPSGIRELFGSMWELTRDEAQPYSAACWQKASIVDPDCTTEPFITDRAMRGSSWFDIAHGMTSRTPFGGLAAGGAMGFRCVYPAP